MTRADTIRLALTRIATRPFGPIEALAISPESRTARDVWLEAEDRLAVLGARLADELHEAAGPGGADEDPSERGARFAMLHLRRAVHNGRPLPRGKLRRAREHGNDALRALLGEYERLHASREEAAARAGELLHQATLASARALADAAGHPLVSEGFSLVSEALERDARRLAKRDPSRWTHDERYAAAKVASYLARFSTKTSPNSVFCATALASIGGERLVLSGEPGIARRDVILSVAESRKIAETLATDAALAPAIRVRANGTLRAEPEGGYVFWKPATFREATDDESLRRLGAHPVLEIVLEEARAAATTRTQLAERVAERTGHAPEAIDGFIGQIIDQGALLAEVPLPYNERRPLAAVTRAARGALCTPPWLEPAERAEAGVSALAEARTGETPRLMASLTDEIDALPHVRPLERDELYRVDTASGLDVTLPASLLRELEAGIAPYVQMFSAMYPTRLSIGAFAKRFLESWPADEDVPLLDLYRAFSQKDETKRPAAFPEPGGADPGGDTLERAKLSARRIREALSRRAREARPGEEIELTEEDVRGWAGDAPPPGWSAGIVFQVAASSPAAVERGDYRLVLSDVFNGTGLALARFFALHGAAANGGPSRFTHDQDSAALGSPTGGTASSQELPANAVQQETMFLEPDSTNPVVRELQRSYARQYPEDALVAELTYNHVARTANAGLRPSLFRHEIELPGDAASPDANVIPLTELAVRWCTGARRFRLRWTTKERDVIPVISSGVAPVGLFDFLVTLGQQGQQYLGLLPGFDDPGTPHWPRIVSGRVVLFRERWVLEKGDWPETAPPGPTGPSGAASASAHFIETQRWRHRRGLPRRVFIHTSLETKPRFIDFDAPVLVDLFRRTTAALEDEPQGRLHVTEMLPGPEEMWIGDSSGERHASEWLVQLEGPSIVPGRSRRRLTDQ